MVPPQGVRVGAAKRGQGGAEALAEAGDTSGAVPIRAPFFDAHWKWLRLIKERHKFFARGYSCKDLRSGRCIGPAFAAVPRLGWRLGSSFYRDFPPVQVIVWGLWLFCLGFLPVKRYSCMLVNNNDSKTRNRLHIYRRPCCADISAARTQIRTAQRGSIHVPGYSPRSVPRRRSRACPLPV